MTLLLYVAIGWLAAAAAVTAVFLGARRFDTIHCLLFGDRAPAPVAVPVARATYTASNDQGVRIAA